MTQVVSLRMPSDKVAAVDRRATDSGLDRTTYLLRLVDRDLAHLENLLACYRYFKECRNCMVHGGGVADQKLAGAQLGLTAGSARVPPILTKPYSPTDGPPRLLQRQVDPLPLGQRLTDPPPPPFAIGVFLSFLFPPTVSLQRIP